MIGWTTKHPKNYEGWAKRTHLTPFRRLKKVGESILLDPKDTGEVRFVWPVKNRPKKEGERRKKARKR